MKSRLLLGLVLLSFGVSQSSARAGAFGLTLVDINNPVVGEVAEHPDGSITVTAGGNDTWDAADSFTYLYEQKAGDFDVKVQLLDLSVDDPAQQDSAKASLHVRANLTQGSPDVMINATPVDGANYLETIWRPRQDTGTTDSPVNGFFKGNGPYDNTFRTANGSQRKVPAYTVVDLRAGLDVGRLSVEAFVRNLTNSHGKTSTGIVTSNGLPFAPNGAIRTGVIRPRTIGLSLTASY